MRCKYYILLTIFLVIRVVTTAQDQKAQSFKRYAVRTIDFNQGLLNNETTGVLTDASGFTWVSTRTGLQRFNGYSLDNINPVIDGDSIRINSHVYLFALQNGNTWISYKNGVLTCNPLTRSFKKIISVKASENSFYPIVPLLETLEGVWCMEQDKGIVIYNIRTGKQKIVDANVTDINNLVNSDDLVTNTIIAVNKKYIFIRIDSHRLMQINTDQHRVRYTSYGGENIIGIGCSSDKLFITTNSHISAINIEDGRAVKSYPLKNIFQDDLLYTCIQSEDNSKVLVSLNRHLYEFDSSLNQANEFISLNEDAIVPNGLIHHIYTDRFKRIWLLTNNDIRIIQNFDVPFQHFIYKNEKSNYTRALYYDEDQHVLLTGCISVENGNNGGIQLYDSSGNPLWGKALTTSKMKNISNIEKLGTGKYLVITSDQQGWYLLDLPPAKKLTKFHLNINAQTESQLNTTVWPNNLQKIMTVLFYCQLG